MHRCSKTCYACGSGRVPCAKWSRGPSPPRITVATDASDVGRGFQSSWGHQACGGWSEESRRLHINLRELTVVRIWLARHPDISGMGVRFDMDNVKPYNACRDKVRAERILSCPYRKTSFWRLRSDVSRSL